MLSTTTKTPLTHLAEVAGDAAAAAAAVASPTSLSCRNEVPASDHDNNSNTNDTNSDDNKKLQQQVQPHQLFATAANLANATAGDDEPLKKRKRGATKGTKRDETKDLKFWYDLCSQYDEQCQQNPKLKQVMFLRSLAKQQLQLSSGAANFSHVAMDDSPSNRQRFSNRYKQYRAGTLQPVTKQRYRAGKYEVVQEKLTDFLESRVRAYKRDRCGLSWASLEEKALEIAQELNYSDFKASPGWLDTTLKKGGYMASSNKSDGVDEETEDDVKLADFTEFMSKARKYVKEAGIEVKYLHQFETLTREGIRCLQGKKKK